MDMMLSRRSNFLREQASFLRIRNRFLLGHGILIERNGTVRWSHNWEQMYYDAYLVEDQKCLLTTRLSRSEAYTLRMGIYCINFHDGTLRWKHHSSNTAEKLRVRKDEERALSPAYQRLDRPRTDGTHLITHDFRIDWDTGAPERRNGESEHTAPVRELEPLPEAQYDWRDVRGRDSSLDLPGGSLDVSGYRFSSYPRLYQTDNRYIVPAQKTGSTDAGRKLLSIDCGTYEIVSERPLPVNGSVKTVAPFFDNGWIVHQEHMDRHYLTIL